MNVKKEKKKRMPIYKAKKTGPSKVLADGKWNSGGINVKSYLSKVRFLYFSRVTEF